MSTALPYLVPADETALLARATRLVYSPGDTIVREGANVQAVYVIRSGRVHLERRAGRRMVLALLDSGDVFGVDAVLGARRAALSYVARDEVGADLIAPEAIEELVAADPGFGVRLFRSLVQVLLDHCRQLADAAGGGD